MSLYYQPRNIVLNTTAASAADVVVDRGIVYLKNNRVGRYLDFTQTSWVKETAITSETAGVVTYTPTTPLNSTTYSFTLTQLVPSAQGVSPKVITKLISVTTPATGSITATTICNQIKNEFFAGQITTYSTGEFQLTTNALAAGTVVMTASSGSPILFASWYNSGGGVAGDLINTTPGVNTRGLPANLIAAGVPSATASGTSYTLYAGQNKEHTGFNNTMQVNQPEEIYIWLNSDMTNFAALITRMDELMNIYSAGGTVVDPLLIEQI